jgi:SAM-dependent methyltransferase
LAKEIITVSQAIVGERTLDPFEFGKDYIAEHFGSNVALATQQMTHSRFRQNPLPFTDHILQALALTGTESVLDLGCGNGFVLRDVVSRLRDGGAAVGFDISETMLELAQRNVNLAWVPLTFQNGTAEDLSRFRDGQFDRVMANFIFHYIEQPDVVCEEVKRVTAGSGHSVISIETRGSMHEMYDQHFAAMERVGFPDDFMARLPRGRRGTMTLDNAGEILSTHFTRVEERPYPDSLRFHAPEQFMRFYGEGHRYLGVRANADERITEQLIGRLHAEVEGVVRERIEKVGYFEISKRTSVFVCS